MKENKLYPEFETEVSKSEYTRTRLTIVILVIAVGIVIVNYFLLDEAVIKYYGGHYNYLITVSWLTIFIGYELLVLTVQDGCS